MPPDDRNPAYLWDIIEAAKDVQQFIKDVAWHEYVQNRMLKSAIERKLEIIGEASRRISETFRRDHPEVPWKSMIGLRNVLAHEYGEILHERLWHVATNLIPTLIEQLTKLMPEPPTEEEDRFDS